MGIFRVIIFMAVATFGASSLLLFARCAASGEVSEPKSIELIDDDHQAKVNLMPSLPRKLIKINKGATTHDVIKRAYDNEGSMLHRELLEASSGNKHGKIKGDNVMHAATKGTWKHQRSDEYSTMDYNWVRRRRPIHNKQIPFAP